MEEIYVNVECDKSVYSGTSTHQTGPVSFYGATIFSLGLLKVFLLAGLIGLGVHYHSSVNNKVASLIEERDSLNAKLSNMTEERNRLQKLFGQERTCPAGWMKFNCFCYLFSNETGSWTTGREDCRKKGADLVVINSADEQTFLSGFTKVDTWIGLSDINKEGTWEWIDGTPLTMKYWGLGQPNNGGGSPKLGEEDCGHIRVKFNDWNDLSCENPLKWICEKLL